LPAGIQLLSTGSYPVLIHQAVPGPAPLIRIVPSGFTGPAVVKGLRLIGGAVGVSLDETTTFVKSAEIVSCRFIRNETGISAIATGGAQIELLTDDCVFEPTTVMLGPATGYRTPSVGLRLHAIQNPGNSAVPRVSSVLSNALLKTGYPTTAALGILVGTDSTPIEMAGTFSRFLEVHSKGHTVEHGGTGIQPIAEVDLEVEGGLFKGGQKWDVFLYSSTESNNTGVEDHTCGYQVDLNGAVIERFVDLGVCAQSGRESRGRVDLSSNTVIREIGYGNTRLDAFQNVYSGLFAFAYKGYLGITGSGFSVLDNIGHGMYFSAAETRMAPGPYPVGLFVGIESGAIHGNDGAGLRFFMPTAGQAALGGTWHEESDGMGGTFLTLIDDGSDLSDLPHGQGFVSRCAISNNGEHGISLLNFLSPPSAISCRFVNSVIWNNPLGGVVAYSSGGIPMTPLFATPIHGCSILGNGSSQIDPFSGDVADYNVEFYESVPLASNIYEWTETTANPNPKSIGTRITNSILMRKIPGNAANDFGPNLALFISGELVPDVNPTVNVVNTKIGVAGCRADPAAFLNQLQAPYMTPVVPQFSGNPINWESRDPLQFGLASLGLNTIMNNTWDQFLYGAIEVFVDYLDITRDPFNGLVDPSAERGAFERPQE
jgi:hypothetical protein